ncbi:MAG TPA: PorT family protein [Bacteroidetes bacterium]|nr:PorT family protein [Bacteroidota bacterium]
MPTLNLKTLFFAIFSLLFSLPISAQTSLSLSVLPGITNINGVSNSRLGGRIGAEIKHQFSGKWEVSSSVGYYSPGDRARFEWQGMGHDNTVHLVKRRLHFIDLEVLADWQILDGIWLGLGPYIAYQSYTSEKHQFSFTDNGVNSETSYTENQTALFKQIDFGIRPSILIRLNENLTFRATFSQGLQNMSVLDFLGVTQYSQAILLGLNWKFYTF